jgi:hypothetical protein
MEKERKKKKIKGRNWEEGAVGKNRKM